MAEGVVDRNQRAAVAEQLDRYVASRDPVVLTFQVSRIYKGTVGEHQEIVIPQPLAGGSCGNYVPSGPGPWLIVAHRPSDAIYRLDPCLYLSGFSSLCPGGSRALANGGQPDLGAASGPDRWPAITQLLVGVGVLVIGWLADWGWPASGLGIEPAPTRPDAYGCACGYIARCRRKSTGILTDAAAHCSSASWWLGGARRADADVALLAIGPTLGDLAAGLVVGDHAFWTPGRLCRSEEGHSVELDRELGSDLQGLEIDRWPLREQDPQPDRLSGDRATDHHQLAIAGDGVA